MKSFEEMFARYFNRVYRFALSLTRSTAQAEDITKQTFYKALKKIDTFEGRSDVVMLDIQDHDGYGIYWQRSLRLRGR